MQQARECSTADRAWTLHAALCAFLAILGSADSHSAALKPKVAGTGLRTCIIPPVALTPLYIVSAPAEAAEDDDDDEEDEDEDSEEDDDEEEDETIGGVITADGSCIGISGGLTASMQVTRLSYPRMIGTRSRDITTMTTTGTLTLDTLSRLGDAFDLRTTVSVLGQPTTDTDPNGMLLTEARAWLGPWTAGYGASAFNFWDGGDFLFGARIPARSSFQMSRTVQFTESWALSVGMERADFDPAVQRPAGLNAPPGMRWPDLVTAISYKGDALDLHLAGALTERRNADGTKAHAGKAAIVGATATFDLLGKQQSLTAQLAGAIDAPLYLGTQVDFRAISSILDGSDTTRGFSALLSSSRIWSEKLATNTYISTMRLDFPKLGTSGGRALIWRGAGNVIFTPVKDARIGLEAGMSYGRFNLPNRIIPIDLGSRQVTAVLWFDRKF